MITLFIFKSNARGMRYGMGTYIRELTDALLTFTHIKLYIVAYHNNECKECSTEKISQRYFRINIPSPIKSSLQKNIYDRRYGSVIVELLADVINENEEIVFQINYIDGLPILKRLKEKYSHPVISVVHLSQWHQLFKGNRRKLKGLNIDKPVNDVEYTLFCEKEMYQLSDRVISLNRSMKESLVNDYGLNPDKIDIVVNGINLSSYKIISNEEKLKVKRKLGFNQHEKIILFSGRIDEIKGIFFLLDAFISACNCMEDLRLVLVGQGNILECLQKYQSFYGKITYTGLLSPEQVVEFYQIADIGIAPSVYDQCPYTILEMMAFRIPLVLSRVDGLNEMLDDRQCIFLNPIVSEEGDISFNNIEFTDAILTLIRDNNMANSLASNAYDRLCNDFSASRMALEMNNIFSHLKTKKQNHFN